MRRPVQQGGGSQKAAKITDGNEGDPDEEELQVPCDNGMTLCKILSLLEGCWASPWQASQARAVLDVFPGHVAPLPGSFLTCTVVGMNT